MRPWLIPLACAEENLFEGIRGDTLSYFREKAISWHDKLPGERPSNHLRDSQICCVNFPAPFAHNPKALAELFVPLFPSLRRLLPMEDDRFVAFEWIGLENYLCEPLYGRPRRSRGEYFTSADAAVRFHVSDGDVEIVLVDWKYTEACNGLPKGTSKNGTDRLSTYRPFYDAPECPLDKTILRRFDDLFYDPFDQLMRLQLLAREMERARELGQVLCGYARRPCGQRGRRASHVTCVAQLGTSACEVWQRLVRPPDRFLAVTIERWYNSLPVEHLPELEDWWSYLVRRYSWLCLGAQGDVVNWDRVLGTVEGTWRIATGLQIR